MSTPDVQFENYGSIWLLTPKTANARQWVEKKVSTESWQWIAGSLAVEPRYVPDLTQGMESAGLTVSLPVHA